MVKKYDLSYVSDKTIHEIGIFLALLWDGLSHRIVQQICHHVSKYQGVTNSKGLLLLLELNQFEMFGDLDFAVGEDGWRFEDKPAPILRC